MAARKSIDMLQDTTANINMHATYVNGILLYGYVCMCVLCVPFKNGQRHIKQGLFKIPGSTN